MIPYARELGALALLAVAGFAGVQTIRLSTEKAAHFQTKTAHAVQLQRLAERAKDVADAAVIAQQAQYRYAAAIDAQRSEEKDHALADNDARRARDLAGSGGMRIPATCPRPAAAPSLPSATASSGVDAQAADIPAAFRQELWDLRAALITEQAQLLALQDYMRRLAAGDKP
ncbi:lysis system i-spanin subunit Rz [Pseudorhodoferax sp. Leaf274]|uniref:lysis system i-spanin subunit Rz n=1 Tax=Pseudorhodoferax sp. Leaf274 TaxID=1736318 RepID=UPI000702A6B2|nr:lysis system i-spanin subunit Rz [Pseudorhodoferax sp. Leaf274]KQP36149.1 hypothetical protein ASF44_16405 [Pseudorhodoferax sp. Leaf274]